jgi:hypothetical protein
VDLAAAEACLLSQLVGGLDLKQQDEGKSGGGGAEGMGVEGVILVFGIRTVSWRGVQLVA